MDSNRIARNLVKNSLNPFGRKTKLMLCKSVEKKEDNIGYVENQATCGLFRDILGGTVQPPQAWLSSDHPSATLFFRCSTSCDASSCVSSSCCCCGARLLLWLSIALPRWWLESALIHGFPLPPDASVYGHATRGARRGSSCPGMDHG